MGYASYDDSACFVKTGHLYVSRNPDLPPSTPLGFNRTTSDATTGTAWKEVRCVYCGHKKSVPVSGWTRIT
jgi:hypothetical protein